MIKLTTYAGNTHKVIEAKVIPAPGAIEQISKVYWDLRDVKNLVPALGGGGYELSTNDLLRDNIELHDPASNVTFQLENLITEKQSRDVIKFGGKTAKYARLEYVNRYATVVRLLYEALLGDTTIDQDLRVMLTGDVRSIMGKSFSNELGDLSGWHGLLQKDCPDFSKFEEIVELITFKETKELGTFELDPNIGFIYLPEYTQKAINNTRLLSLVNKDSDYRI